MIQSTSLYHPSARMTSITSATFSFILSPVTPFIPECPSKYGFYILINTMYCYPCRSRELIRAGCCWLMLFELLIKIILVVLCYSVNSYMIPLKYSVAEVAEWRKLFRHLRQKRHFTHLHFLTSLFCRCLVQFVLYQQIELVLTTISPSFVLQFQGLPLASRRLVW